jgi:predicted dehydrogenase
VGGSVLLTGVHIFDLARFLSRQEFLSIDSRQRQVLHPQLEDNFLARGILQDGTWVSLEVSKFTRSVSCWLEVVGEEAQLLADYRFGGIHFIQNGQLERIEVDGAAPTVPPTLAAWLASVRGETEVPVSVQDGLLTLEIAAACYRSQQENREVRLEELHL